MVVFADGHDRAAGKEGVAHDADEQAGEVGLQTGGKAFFEGCQLAVLLDGLAVCIRQAGRILDEFGADGQRQTSVRDDLGFQHGVQIRGAAGMMVPDAAIAMLVSVTHE